MFQTPSRTKRFADAPATGAPQTVYETSMQLPYTGAIDCDLHIPDPRCIRFSMSDARRNTLFRDNAKALYGLA